MRVILQSFSLLGFPGPFTVCCEPRGASSRMANFRAHFENTSSANLNGSDLNPVRFLDVARPSAMHGNLPGVTRFAVISRDRGSLPQGLFAGFLVRFGAKNHVAAGNTFGM